MFLFSSPQRLRIFGNRIHVIEKDAFVGLHSLIILDLTYCGLDTMPPLNPIKSTLQTLHLGQNNLFNISADYFHGFINLKYITLYDNNFSLVPNIIPCAATIQYLYMGTNAVQTFEPFLTNTTFTAVLRLRLSDNRIRYLSRDMIRCWPNLLTLHLTNNFLKSLEDLTGVTRSTLLEVLYGFVNINPGYT